MMKPKMEPITAPITAPFDGVSDELGAAAAPVDAGPSPSRIVVIIVVDGRTCVRVLYTAVGSALGVIGKFGIENAQLPQQLGCERKIKVMRIALGSV